MKEEYWETKDGKKIAVGDMKEDHVRNVLRLILRKKRYFEELNIDQFDCVVTDDIY
jgi:hypothetical protein